MRSLHQPAGGDFHFGLELIMDVHNCDPAVITDADAIRRFTAGLVEQIKMLPYGETWLHHFGHANAVTAGYTAFQAIETSSIIVHVSEGPLRVHVNVFSCQLFDCQDAMDYTEQFFGGTDTTYTILSR